MNPDVDDWINSHCLDADVFVLVSNAESTLMNAVRNKNDNIIISIIIMLTRDITVLILNPSPFFIML